MEVLPSVFSQWLEMNKDQFAIAVLWEPREDHLYLSFSVLQGVMDGCAHSKENGWAEIVISVEYEGEFWDIIFNPDLEAKCEERGWFCALCAEHGTPYQFFKTLEELWIEHLFNPFLDWINGKLAKAEALALCGSIEGGMTWAALVGDGFPKQERIKALLRIPPAPHAER
jgi:hypothetical protein